jgi:hypothetical protein
MIAMPTVVPNRFLVRMAWPCRHLKGIPILDERPVVLGESCRIDNFAALDGRTNFADVRMAWNVLGVGVQVEVRGKERPLVGDSSKPRSADGLTLWIDTRDARTSHRASRTCHQFHFLPAADGAPWFGPAKINRALQDAPLCQTSDVPFTVEITPSGYIIAAFLSAAVLTGFDPDQHPRLGFFYCVKDNELGEETLSVNSDFPYWDDPSLWGVLELKRDPA